MGLNKLMRKILKKLLIIILIVTVFFTVSFIRHKISLLMEEPLRTPLGKIVEVDGHNMSVYVEGEGKHTIVFLSGGGTSSPILDFKSLYTLLVDDYRIVVIEKFGYGFSDVVDDKRDIATVLRQSRTALEKLDIAGPYILCPHSMSGIEALYWAQMYPWEIEAIIGLDMAVPGYYEFMNINIPMIKLGHYGAVLGITRWIPGISESEAIKHGNLTDSEKEIYRSIFYYRTATLTMVNEVKEIKNSAKVVDNNGVPDVPILLFISNSSGTAGFDEQRWRSIAKEYIAKSDKAEYIELDCPHYVHDYFYKEISEYIKDYINTELDSTE